MLFSTSFLWCNLFFSEMPAARNLRCSLILPALWRIRNLILQWIRRHVSFTSIRTTPTHDFLFTLPLAWLRLRPCRVWPDMTEQLNLVEASTVPTLSCAQVLNVPEENVSSDEELYTPFERCNMSAPPVLQDSHSLRCCKDLLEMPVYNGALCCTNLSVTSLSLSLQDRTRRTYGPIVPLILGSTSEQRTSIHKSV